MTWKPIVAGVDGSPESIDAAALAWRIAEAAGTKCVFVYALPEPWPGGLEPLLYTPQVLERLTADVRRLVEQGLRRESPAAARQPLLVRTGRPGVVLAEVANEQGAELVVVAGRPHGALARGLGGSTAHFLVRTLHTPLLVVGPGMRRFGRLLVAADLSEAAKPTLAVGERYAGLLGARLRALHVVEPARFPPVIPLSLDPAEYERRCREAFAQLAPPLDHTVRRGVAVETIAEEAATWKADLIVIGSHGKGWVERALIGSTTERLLNLLPASLLVVPILHRARRRVRGVRRTRRRTETPRGRVVV